MAKLNLSASEAIAEVRKLINEIEALKKSARSINSSTSANFSAMEGTINSLRQKVILLSQKLKYMEAILNKNSSATKSNTKAKLSNTDATNKNAIAQGKNSSQTDKATKSTNKFSLSIKSLVSGGFFLKLISMANQLSKNIYSNIKTFDSLAFTLEKITKTNFEYENSQRYLLRLTQAYGVELVATTERYSRFLAAANESGLAIRDTENIFESMTKASAALGLGTDELTSVYLALEQMLSKGKITTEELRRQLGERLPGAMGIMASSMGVTIPKLDEMLKKGEVLSADVLPEFARAVERAYGIEHVRSIETLIAKQNRLSASWQTFIKNLSEGDSVIKNVLGGFISLLNETVSAWDRIFMSEKQEMRLEISLKEDEFINNLEKSSARFIDMTSEMSEQEVTLKLNEKRFREQLMTASGDEREIIKENLENIARIRADKDAKAVENSKAIARQNIDIAYDEYKQSKAIYEDIKAEYDKIRSGEIVSGKYKQADKDKAYSDLVQTEAKYNVLRKLIEESDITVIKEEQVTKSQRILRKIRDYYLETMNEIAGMVKDSNLDIFGDETLDLDVRLEALKKASQQEIQIRENMYKILERDLDAKLKAEVSSVEKSVKDGALSRAKANEHILALEEEKNSNLMLGRQKLLSETLKINRSAADEINKLAKDVFDNNEVGVVTNIFDKRIIAANEEYEHSKKTAKDKEKLERDLVDITIESTNAIIDVKKNLLEQEINILESSGNANGEYIKKLRREIDSLEAGKMVKPPIDKYDWKKTFKEAIAIAKNFNKEIGGLVDARFARNIENIGAEIKAEEEKYDRLIMLARDDEEQRQTLQRNKDDAVKKLEAKRLKEQQKQAKANKAFAIAQIIMDTSVAIMKTYATAGFFGGAIGAAIVSALGAVQIATVLSAPIPKYKDGVDNLRQDEVAMINDGSYKEYVERNGRILTTSKKNAIVDLKEGDTVYKNYDDMVSRSKLFKIKNESTVKKHSEDKLLKDITSSIIKGFSKSKINNNVNINQKNNDTSYESEMSRWT